MPDNLTHKWNDGIIITAKKMILNQGYQNGRVLKEEWGSVDSGRVALIIK